MRYFNRSVITICICLIALANIQCARDGRGNETESPTLTIHVPGGDERVIGPAGSLWSDLVFLGLAVGSEYSDDPEPRLLDRWERTPDYREWTIHVRE